jgi:hypothetical protein
MTKSKFALVSLLPPFIVLAVIVWLSSAIYDEYGPYQYLRLSLSFIGWSLFALVFIVISLLNLKNSFRSSSKLTRLITIAADAILALLVIGSSVLGLYAAYVHVMGRDAYQNSIKTCGHPPVLAEEGFTHINTYISPGSSEYERLKYSPGEPSIKIFGPTKYICSAKEAESQGYVRQ